MSHFVDFSKRSITLPEGCKNLVEMLGRKTKSDDSPIIGWPGNLSRHSPRISEIALCNLPNVVRFLFQPGARKRSAVLCTPEEREIISLGWNNPRTELQGIFCFPENPSRAREADRFLASLGKQPTPPKFKASNSEALKPDELLNFNSFATNELELNTLLRRFFNEFLNLPPDTRLTCIVSGQDKDDSKVSGAAKN